MNRRDERSTAIHRKRARSTWRFGAARLTRPLAILLALALAACGRRGSAGIDLERMIDQVRFDAYGANPLFADGRALRVPPEGTVPRERIVGDPAVASGLVDGAFVTTIPVPVTAATLDVGRKQFEIYCAACHGAGGFGGSQVAVNMLPPRPPSLVAGRVAALPVGSVFQTISRGFGRMPTYAEDLSVPQRWAVIAYITRVLQSPHPLSPDQLRDSIQASALATPPDSATGSPASPSVKR